MMWIPPVNRYSCLKYRYNFSFLDIIRNHAPDVVRASSHHPIERPACRESTTDISSRWKRGKPGRRARPMPRRHDGPNKGPNSGTPIHKLMIPNYKYTLNSIEPRSPSLPSHFYAMSESLTGNLQLPQALFRLRIIRRPLSAPRITIGGYACRPSDQHQQRCPVKGRSTAKPSRRRRIDSLWTEGG